MALELSIGDIVRMKKSHPCGNSLWEVTRLGADIGLVCQQCRRYVMLPRPYLERRVREVLPGDRSNNEIVSPGNSDSVSG
jgi:hypothetical protein